MSTKCTILYSRKDDWHFYFDYMDMATHFTVKGKETELPDSFLQAAKEAIPDIFRTIASGTPCKKAIEKLAPAVSKEELELIVKKIIKDRAEFVHQKATLPMSPMNCRN